LSASKRFLRKNRKKSNGEVYEYRNLCETVRAELGPRQGVVATLCKLSEEDLAAGWEDIESLLIFPTKGLLHYKHPS
jgi:hypothetical protein